MPRRFDSRKTLWHSRHPGYPAQPDRTEKPLIFDPLQVGETMGIMLAESWHVSGSVGARPVLRPFRVAIFRRQFHRQKVRRVLSHAQRNESF